MKKAIKIIFGIIAVLLLLVVALVLTLPLWLGPVVKPSANTLVPQFTKTSFNLGHLALNPYTGRFELGDMQLGNPSNYDEKRALTLNRLAVDVAMDSLATDTIRIEEVTIDGVFVSYVFADGVNNFDQIQYNVAGGKEKYEANKAKAAAEKKAEGEGTKVESEGEGSSKRVVVDKLVISDIKVKVGPLTLPVPSITLTDIGKKSNGVTLVELFDEIMQAILKGATETGDGLKALGGLLGGGAKNLGGLLGDGAKTLGVDKATDALGKGAGKTVDVVGEGAKKAADVVGSGAKAVGEGAKKAADALKNLF